METLNRTNFIYLFFKVTILNIAKHSLLASSIYFKIKTVLCHQANKTKQNRSACLMAFISQFIVTAAIRWWWAETVCSATPGIFLTRPAWSSIFILTTLPLIPFDTVLEIILDQETILSHSRALAIAIFYVVSLFFQKSLSYFFLCPKKWDHEL